MGYSIKYLACKVPLCELCCWKCHSTWIFFVYWPDMKIFLKLEKFCFDCWLVFLKDLTFMGWKSVKMHLFINLKIERVSWTWEFREFRLINLFKPLNGDVAAEWQASLEISFFQSYHLISNHLEGIRINKMYEIKFKGTNRP